MSPREALERSGLPQDELASRLQVTRSAVSMWIVRGRVPDDMLPAFARECRAPELLEAHSIVVAWRELQARNRTRREVTV